MLTWLTAHHDIAGFILTRLWRASWEGAVALAIAWLLCRIFSKAPARLKCWLWRLAYCKLLLSLFWLAPVNIPVLRANSKTAPDFPFPTQFQVSAPAPLPATSSAFAGMTPRPALGTPALPLSSLILALWLAGALWHGLQLLQQWRHTRRVHAACGPVNEPQASECCTQLSREFRLARPPALLSTELLHRPLLLGLRHPAIVLPAEHLVDGREDLRLVLAHELGHLARGDLWWNWLPVASTTLFWFHPLAWLSRHEWHLAQETACDELAITRSRAPVADYAQMLLRAAAQPPPLITLGTAGTVTSCQNLERRLKAMKHFGSLPKPLLFTFTAIVVLCGLLGLVPWKAVARASADNPPGPPANHPAGGEVPAAAPSTATPLVLQGVIQPNAKLELHAKSPGVIEKVGFQEGASVHQGQLLVQLASPGVEADLMAAQAECRQAELSYTRLHTIDAQHTGLVDQATLEQAKSALEVSRAKIERLKAQLAQTRLTAPWDAIMGASELQPGQTVTPTTPLGTLYDLSSFKVQFTVPSQYILQLHKGQKVRVTVERSSPEPLEGEIYFIAPAIDETTRTCMVKANLAKSAQRLWPGMFARVILDLSTKDGGPR